MYLRHTTVRRKGKTHTAPRAPSPGVSIDPVADNTVLLNHTGAAIVELCDGVRDARAIADELARRFDVDIELARPDVERTLADLRGQGILGR